MPPKYDKKVRPVAPTGPQRVLTRDAIEVSRGPRPVVPLGPRPDTPAITELLRHKIGMRRVSWIGARYAINFSTAAIFIGLIWTAKSSEGRPDMVTDVRN